MLAEGRAAQGTEEPDTEAERWAASSVFVGTNTAYSGRGLSQVPQFVSYSSALEWIQSQRATNRKAYRRTLAALRAAGYLGERSSAMSSVDSAWERVVQDAIRASAASGRQVSPFDILNEAASQGSVSASSGGSGYGGGGGGGGAGSVAQYLGPVTTTSQSTSVDLTNPESARGLVQQAISQLLGRDATAEEVAQFTAALNASERENPRTQSSTQTITQGDGMADGGSSTSSSQSGGGVDGGMQAIDYARSRPDFAEHQAATTYMDAFLSAIEAPVRV